MIVVGCILIALGVGYTLLNTAETLNNPVGEAGGLGLGGLVVAAVGLVLVIMGWFGV